MNKNNKNGLTLIEVVLASAILSMCLTGMLVCLSRCIAVMRASRRYHNAITVLGMGDVKHPPRYDQDIEDIEVDDDSDIMEGYVYSRVLDGQPYGEDNDMYQVRTRVTWTHKDRESYHEVVQYIYYVDDKK